MVDIPVIYQKKWAGLVSAPKVVFNLSDWREEPRNPPPATELTQRKHTVISFDAGRYICQIQLADQNGIVIEGATLRISVPLIRQNNDMTATLECLDWQSSWVCIQRLDANPTAPHANLAHPKGIIEGSHLHPFELNAKMGVAGIKQNLPSALEINEKIVSFRDFFRVVCFLFNIEQYELPSPPWNERLL